MIYFVVVKTIEDKAMPNVSSHPHNLTSTASIADGIKSRGMS